MFIFQRVSLSLILVGLLITGVVALSGCDTVESGGDGTLRVLLTDEPFPFDHVAEARVTIDRVEIIPGAPNSDDEAPGDGAAAFLVSDVPQSFNLLDLRDGVTAVLGEIELPAAPYAQVRLHVSGPLVIMNDGTEFALKVPSSVIKIVLPAFEVVEEGVTELTLDFRVDHSFVVRGDVTRPDFKGFIFKPVVKAIRYVVAGEATDLDDSSSDAPVENEFEVDGPVEALTETSVTVGGVEILVDEETQFQNVSGLSDISAGDTVEVRYRLEESGDLTAITLSVVAG